MSYVVPEATFVKPASSFSNRTNFGVSPVASW
jgi:hypothetical protein